MTYFSFLWCSFRPYGVGGLASEFILFKNLRIVDLATPRVFSVSAI